MVSSRGKLCSKKLIKIIKSDNCDDFMEHINKKKENNDKIFNSVIKFNKKKILNKYLGVINIKTKYFIYLINLNYRNNCKEWYHIFFKMFLYCNLNDFESNIIIDHLIKKKCWILVEYLHLYGFRIKNIKLLYEKIPVRLIDKYISYGYNINKEIFIRLIKKKNIDIFFLEKFSKYKYIFNNTVTLKNMLINISRFQSVDILEYFLKYVKNIPKVCFKNSFSYSNYEIIKYLLNKEYYFDSLNIKKLLTNKNKNIFNKKYFNIKIRNVNYEKNIINILKILNKKLLKKDLQSLKIILKKMIFCYLNNNFFDLLLFIKNSMFITLKLSQIYLNDYIIKNIREDNISNIKRMLDLNLINSKFLYNQKKYMDIALIYNSNSIISFFHNKLNMICSYKALNNYKLFICRKNKCVYKNMSNSINYIKNLKLINYNLNINFLNMSSEFNKVKSVKYLLNENIKSNFKTFELALYNENIKILKYLRVKDCKYKKKKKINIYLKYKKKYYLRKKKNKRY
jgi:hypothetical protein